MHPLKNNDAIGTVVIRKGRHNTNEMVLEAYEYKDRVDSQKVLSPMHRTPDGAHERVVEGHPSATLQPYQ